MERANHPDPHQEAAIALGHEERDVRARPVAVAALALAVVCIVAGALMHLLFNVFASMESYQSAVPSPLQGAYGQKEPPAPRLQTAPLQDLATLRARDAALLDGYAWVKREDGIVRIPIDRAIEVLAARGLPARPAPASQPQAQKDQP
jgi:hypothetical protein